MVPRRKPQFLDGPPNPDGLLWPDDTDYRLTPAEIESLRKQFQEAEAWMEAELARLDAEENPANKRS
jgi:hypothetical protein